jgi:dTDP-4-dehydrorhamnose reductase
MYLLTGGSGTLGTELQKHLDCWIPVRENFDVTDSVRVMEGELWSMGCDWSKIGAVIHCAGYTDVPGAEVNKREAIEVNITGTKNIVELAKLHDKRVIYISTDYVYAGIAKGYREVDVAEPFNFYGFTKLAGEAYVDLDKDLVVRTSFKKANLWNTKLNKAFVDIHTSADFVDIIAKDIVLLIKNDINGIVNVGTERKTIYDLACRRNPSVEKISRFEINCRMPKDISMDISKLEKIKKHIKK